MTPAKISISKIPSTPIGEIYFDDAVKKHGIGIDLIKSDLDRLAQQSEDAKDNKVLKEKKIPKDSAVVDSDTTETSADAE